MVAPKQFGKLPIAPDALDALDAGYALQGLRTPGESVLATDSLCNHNRSTSMSNTATITRQQVSDDQRINHTAELFGIHFPLHLEPYVYAVTKAIAREYNGGYWEFYALSNGGFYMSLNSKNSFNVTCENGFEGDLSADALGITACLYAYSHLSYQQR